MALDNFRTQKIIWDRANKKIFENIEANSGDSNGRKLVVQVINQEATENLSGTTLSLGWKSIEGAKGLDAFNVVDASKGIFEIYYTTEMLSNIGNLEASLILIDSTSRIESSTFTISVRPSTVDDESVESENSFTALTEALVKVNDFTAQLAQKITQGVGGVTDADLSQEVKEQMTGGSVAVVGKQMLLTENFVSKQITPKLTDFVLEKENDVVTSEVNVLTDFERNDGIFVNPLDGQETSNAGYTTFTIPLSDEISIFHAFLNTAILGYSPASYYDKDNVFISGYQPVLNSQSEQVTYKSYSGIFYNKPANAKTIKISVALSRLEPPITILLMLTTQRTGTVLSIPSLDLNTRVKSLEEGYSGGGVLTNKKIVNFGDSIFGNYRDTSDADKSISKMIAERTGATVYNAGFGGCRMATHSNFWDAFSMHSLADSIATGNWAKQDQALIDGAGTLPSYFSETLSMLKTIVWSAIDIITIGYWTNDYSGNIFIEHNAAFKEWDYFKGALKYSIAKILSAHKHIKIVVLSPMWRWFLSDGVYSYDSDAELSKNTRGYILPEYVSACEEISRECHVLYLDNYYSLGINKYNYLEYFSPTDGTHPNLSGRELRANRIVGQLIANI